MRHLSRMGCAAAVGLLAVAGQISAAELQKGAWELGLSALMQDADQTGVYLNVASRIGYVFTPHHEAGASISVLWVKPDNQGNITASVLGGFYRYNFSTTDRYMVPFVGALAYSYQGDLRQSLRWGWQFESGVRFMPTPAAGINATIFWKREFATATYVTTDRAFGMTVGFSLFL